MHEELLNILRIHNKLILLYIVHIHTALINALDSCMGELPIKASLLHNMHYIMYCIIHIYTAMDPVAMVTCCALRGTG